MRSVQALLLAAAALAAAPAPAAALRWKISSSSCDGSPFRDLKISVACDGSSSCDLGDTATVTGTVYAASDFDDDKVKLQACFTSYCPEYAATDAGNVCDWLTGADGQECGAAGSYGIYREEEIPSSEQVPSNLYSWLQGLVTIRIAVGDEDECEAESGAYSTAYSAAGLAGLALAGAAYAAKRRRRGGAGDDEQGTEFVQMGDSHAVV